MHRRTLAAHTRASHCKTALVHTLTLKKPSYIRTRRAARAFAAAEAQPGTPDASARFADSPVVLGRSGVPQLVGLELEGLCPCARERCKQRRQHGASLRTRAPARALEHEHAHTRRLGARACAATEHVREEEQALQGSARGFVTLNARDQPFGNRA
eukprot:4918531-Pleurochrysis_carterae.AAC.1